MTPTLRSAPGSREESQAQDGCRRVLTWEKELMHLTPGASGCDGELSPQPGGEVTEARGSEVAGRSPRRLEWRPVRGVLVADPGALAKDVCAPSSGLHVLPGCGRPLSHGGFWVPVRYREGGQPWRGRRCCDLCPFQLLRQNAADGAS